MNRDEGNEQVGKLGIESILVTNETPSTVLSHVF